MKALFTVILGLAVFGIKAQTPADTNSILINNYADQQLNSKAAKIASVFTAATGAWLLYVGTEQTNNESYRTGAYISFGLASILAIGSEINEWVALTRLKDRRINKQKKRKNEKQ